MPVAIGGTAAAVAGYSVIAALGCLARVQSAYRNRRRLVAGTRDPPVDCLPTPVPAHVARRADDRQPRTDRAANGAAEGIRLRALARGVTHREVGSEERRVGKECRARWWRYQ